MEEISEAIMELSIAWHAADTKSVPLGRRKVGEPTAKAAMNILNSRGWILIKCKHDYEEVSSTDFVECKIYKCKLCNHRYKLYYEDLT